MSAGAAHRIALATYRAATAAAALAGTPYLAWRAVRHGREVQERLALGWPRIEGHPPWLHGASVGEVRGLGAVAQALAARGETVVATAVTPAGVAALTRFGLRAFFLPLDVPGAPERALSRLAPRFLLIFETEIWPGLWGAARTQRVPIAVANARLGEGALRRYRAVAALIVPLVRGAALVAAQSEADAQRWLRLGAEPAAVVVTGSTKHDVSVDAAGAARVRQRLSARRIAVAGSTRPGEEEIVLAAWESARTSREWILALAPRHASRFDEVASILQHRGRRFIRWSGGDDVGEAEIVLVDTLGELNAFYAASEIAFVGGSLLPFGGHNVLEPAAAGVPVLFGPHTENAGDTPARLLESGGALCVHDATEAGAVLARLMASESERRDRGRAALRSAACEAGATGRLLEALETRGLL